MLLDARLQLLCFRRNHLQDVFLVAQQSDERAQHSYDRYAVKNTGDECPERTGRETCDHRKNQFDRHSDVEEDDQVL